MESSWAPGAARAIGFELALAGAGHLRIVNRTPERARELAESIRQKTGVPTEPVAWEADYPIPDDAEVVINATSIGLYPDLEARVPLVLDTLHPGLIVCDVIPNPPRTRLLRDAESRGCTTLDGLGMLVNQGIIGIQVWSGQSPDPEVMRQALQTLFAS